MKKFSKYVLITAVSFLTLSTFLPALTTYAAVQNLSSNLTKEKDSNSLTKQDIEFLNSLGLSSNEIQDTQQKNAPSITLTNGLMRASNPLQRGKWSSAAKILIKNYNRLPGWIKAVVGYGAANSLAKTLEKFNGTLTDGLSLGLEMLGFSPGVARYFAKGIAWALF